MLPKIRGARFLSTAASTLSDDQGKNMTNTGMTGILAWDEKHGASSPSPGGSEQTAFVPRRKSRHRIRSLPRRDPLKRRRRRRRRRTDEQNDLFTTFTLNRDPENSKYLPYEEIVYPKLFNRPLGAGPQTPATGTAEAENLGAAAELDSMWVVGFVEDARRRQKELLLKELRDFVRLPGSEVLPGARGALSTISSISSRTTLDSLERSMVKPESDGVRAKDEGGSAQTGGTRDGCEMEDQDDGRASSLDGTTMGSSSALTPFERSKLRQLERRLAKSSLDVGKGKLGRHAGIAAYNSANRKLKKILRGSKLPHIIPAVKSQGLEEVLRRSRDELAAAVRIQRVYKQYYRQKRFKILARQIKGVILIQALARGVLARRFVAEWYVRRSAMILSWQTVIRRMLSNIRWRRRLEVEQSAASRLQATLRGYLGRKKARDRRRSLAVLRIQCLWRGCVERGKADRLWLGAQATRIQCLARVVVARRSVQRKRRISNAAVTSIQRCFRGFVARRFMRRLIWERGIAQRVDFVRVLAAEEEWLRENIELTQRRCRRMGLQERLKEALDAEAVAHRAVLDLENHAQDLRAQRQMLSPRALQQGWKEELEENTKQHREWITRKKLETVFDMALPARELEEEVHRRDSLRREQERQASQLARWREREMKDIFDRESRRRFDDEHLRRRKQVGEEKRKWTVSFFTPSGKPDKLKTRRRIRPWEAAQDPIESAMKQVFTEGTVDLLAYDRSDEDIKPESAALAPRGSAENRVRDRTVGGRREEEYFFKRGSLARVMACLKLQSHMNQVAQFENIMDPAQDILNKTGFAASVLAAGGASLEASKPSGTGPPPTPAVGLGKAQGAGEDSPKTPGLDAPRPVTTRVSSHRISAAGFPIRHGAAASTPLGRPPPLGAGGTPAPIQWGEEERIRTRMRQRRLYMLAQADSAPDTDSAGEAGTGGEASPRQTGGDGDGDGDGDCDGDGDGDGDGDSDSDGDGDGDDRREPGAGQFEAGEERSVDDGARGGRGVATRNKGSGSKRSFGRVPWELLDELEAEKAKLAATTALSLLEDDGGKVARGWVDVVSSVGDSVRRWALGNQSENAGVYDAFRNIGEHNSACRN